MNFLKKEILTAYSRMNPRIRIERKMREQLFFQRKMIMDDHLLHLKESGVTSHRYGDADIIVSLTTYGRRIYSVYATIESLMEQTMKANRIILWLDTSFQGKPLPQSIEMLKQRGLEVAFCKDVRSYKKLVPALCNFPDAAIITADDDLIYEVNMLENLISAYLADPQYIYCNRAHRMLLDKEGHLKPYNDWQYECRDTEASHLIFPTGVGGALYPPHCLAPEVLDSSVFMDICPYADDVWFKAMALKAGMKARRVDTISSSGCEYLENPSVQDMGLFNINVCSQNRNDEQIRAVFNKYNLYHLLK